MSVPRSQSVPFYLLGGELQKFQTSRTRRDRPIGGRTPLHFQLLVDKLPQAEELMLEKQDLREFDHFFVSYDFINNFEQMVQDEAHRQLTRYEEVGREWPAIGIERFSVLEYEVLVGIFGQKKEQVGLLSFRRLIPYVAQKRF